MAAKDSSVMGVFVGIDTLLYSLLFGRILKRYRIFYGNKRVK